MITLKHLKWDNCFSYGEGNELALNDTTVTQILGTNGVGKSSIPLIIEEALFNKNSKGVKKSEIPNRYGNGKYRIELDFSIEDNEYKVIVSRGNTVRVTLSCNGEDISSHTATNTFKTIQELIGIDFRTFSQLVYQNTNASLQFLTATDSNRKKFLIDLLHLNEYVELFELFKNLTNDQNTELTKIQSKFDTIESWLSENILEDTTILPLKEIEIQTEKEEKRLSELSTEIKNITQKNSKIVKNNSLIEQLEQLDKQKAEHMYEGEKLDVQKFEFKRHELAMEERQLMNEVKKWESQTTECYACGQPLPDTVDYSERIEKHNQKIAEVRDQVYNQDEILKDMREHNRKVELYKTLENKWLDTYRLIDKSLSKVTLDPEDLRDQVNFIQKQLTEKQNAITRITKENEAIAERNSKIKVILEQKDKFQAQLDEVKNVLDSLKVQVSHLEVLKKAFSTNGLLAYKIENLVVELEEVANKYLADLSDGRFTLGFLVEKDKLNVEITDNGKQVDILALSSGELARVNTATLIAIRKLMSSISKSKINILFLDEVINVLDEQGRERLVEILVQEQELNTYIVSHQWSHPLLEKLSIVKEDNISHIEK